MSPAPLLPLTWPRSRSRRSSVVCTVLAACLALSLPGCGRKAPTVAPDAVALVEGVPISSARVLESWSRRTQGGNTNLPASVVLADLIDAEAAYQQAARSGFLDRADVKEALKSFAITRYREEMHGKLLSQPEPAEQEVREEYAMRRSSFIRPPAINLGILFLQVPRKATDEKRQEALQLITKWREQVAASKDQGKAFSELVAAHSSDTATRYKRGELGWMTAEQMALRLPRELISEAMAITNGVLSQPLQGPDGYYLLRGIAFRPATQQPFEEVQALLRHQMRERRRTTAQRQLREQLRAGLNISTNEPILQGLVLTNKPIAPPPPLPKQ